MSPLETVMTGVTVTNYGGIPRFWLAACQPLSPRVRRRSVLLLTSGTPPIDLRIYWKVAV
jgi:hypothetical protein